MANTSKFDSEMRPARYEFRVWGKHRKVRKMLPRLASSVEKDSFEDCYLLVDNPAWNAKVRDNTLKIKELVAKRKGFEQWVRGSHLSAQTTPSPFDTLFADLRLDRPQRGKKYNLPKEVKKLDPTSGVRAVFVTKHRHRYRIDELRADVTDIEIHETELTLHTLAIEGDNLKELVRLRKKLGLRDEPNRPVHELIDTTTSE